MERPPSMEYIPTREEVLLEIEKLCKNPAIKRELRDEKGIYLLEVQEESQTQGESVEYRYQRKGVFPNKNESVTTAIHVLFLKDDEPVGGHVVATYDPQTKRWE